MVKVRVKKGKKTYSYDYDYVTVKISQKNFHKLAAVKDKMQAARRRQQLPGKITMNAVVGQLVEEYNEKHQRKRYPF